MIEKIRKAFSCGGCSFSFPQSGVDGNEANGFKAQNPNLPR